MNNIVYINGSIVRDSTIKQSQNIDDKSIDFDGIYMDLKILYSKIKEDEKYNVDELKIIRDAMVAAKEKNKFEFKKLLNKFTQNIFNSIDQLSLGVISGVIANKVFS